MKLDNTVILQKKEDVIGVLSTLRIHPFGTGVADSIYAKSTILISDRAGSTSFCDSAYLFTLVGEQFQCHERRLPKSIHDEFYRHLTWEMVHEINQTPLTIVDLSQKDLPVIYKSPFGIPELNTPV